MQVRLEVRLDKAQVAKDFHAAVADKVHVRALIALHTDEGIFSELLHLGLAGQNEQQASRQLAHERQGTVERDRFT